MKIGKKSTLSNLFLHHTPYTLFHTHTCAMFNYNSILFTFYLFYFPTIGTYDGSWGTEYCVCREKAVPLHQI